MSPNKKVTKEIGQGALKLCAPAHRAAPFGIPRRALFFTVLLIGQNLLYGCGLAMAEGSAHPPYRISELYPFKQKIGTFFT